MKNEERVATIVNLVKLYDGLNIILNDMENVKIYKIAVETKVSIFLAYAKLEDESWSEMEKYLTDAVAIFNELYNEYELEENKNIQINKCYIMLNELKTSIELQDRDVFLQKYKNLLQEMEKLTT